AVDRHWRAARRPAGAVPRHLLTEHAADHHRRTAELSRGDDLVLAPSGGGPQTPGGGTRHGRLSERRLDRSGSRASPAEGVSAAEKTERLDDLIRGGHRDAEPADD